MKLLKEEIELNTKLWENNSLKPEVKNKLIEIANKFINNAKELNIPLNVVDLWLVGSNASYNYTEYSDIDLHIMVNLENESNKLILTLLYNYYKSAFNDKYDIKIYNIPVELYIQDINSPIESKGIYSIVKEEWIREPEVNEIEKPDITKVLEYTLNKYNEVIKLNNKEMIENFLNTLYNNRVRSLALEGEYGIDNLVFKELRNKGYIQNLKDKIKDAESYELSLESLIERFSNDLIKGE